MKNLLILSLTLAFASCGVINPPFDTRATKSGKNKYSTTNPEFFSHIREYEEEMGVSASHVPVNFDTKEIEKMQASANRQIAGVCVYNGSSWTIGPREIFVREDYWNSLSYMQQKILVYHELEHCVRNKDHNAKTCKGIPVSIMYPTLLDASLFYHFEEGYITELKTGTDTLIKNLIANVYGNCN